MGTYEIKDPKVIKTVEPTCFDDVSMESDEEYWELRNEIMQLIHHKGYGVGNSAVAIMLRELGDYYGQ